MVHERRLKVVNLENEAVHMTMSGGVHLREVVECSWQLLDGVSSTCVFKYIYELNDLNKRIVTVNSIK